MNWNLGPRRVRTSAVGALAIAGLIGAALLATPLASSHAADSAASYFNGGFCYVYPPGQPNPSRLVVSEPKFDPNAEATELSFTVQKWDNSSNEYADWDDVAGQFSNGSVAFTQVVTKAALRPGGYYEVAKWFCYDMTNRHTLGVGVDPKVFSKGEWTSKRTIG